MSSFNRSVRLRQGYGGTAFAGFARFRLVNPPLTADGLPGRKKIRQGILPDFRRLVGVVELESTTSTMSKCRGSFIIKMIRRFSVIFP